MGTGGVSIRVERGLMVGENLHRQNEFIHFSVERFLPHHVTQSKNYRCLSLRSLRVLMIATMEPFDDRTLEPPEDRGYGAS